MITVSSDGYWPMTGIIMFLITQINHVTSPRLICVWFGLHKIDLVIQRVYRNGLNNEYFTTLTSLIKHLCHQQNLIQDMHITLMKVLTTRCLNIQSRRKWITDNIIHVQEHLDIKKPRCNPKNCWWLFIFAVNAFTDE